MKHVGILAALAMGCAPEYPNDENHQGVSNEDCVACHVDRLDETLDPPELPDKHFKNGEVKSSKKECKECHDQR